MTMEATQKTFQEIEEMKKEGKKLDLLGEIEAFIEGMRQQFANAMLF